MSKNFLVCLDYIPMCFFKPEKISKNNATSCRNVNALSLKSRKKYPLMEKKNFIEYYLGIFSDRIKY